jgi:hypothetical protein
MRWWGGGKKPELRSDAAVALDLHHRIARCERELRAIVDLAANLNERLTLVNDHLRCQRKITDILTDRIRTLEGGGRCV